LVESSTMDQQQSILANLSTNSLIAKLKKLDAVYHITQDVNMRYKLMNAEDEIKNELIKRGINDKPI